MIVLQSAAASVRKDPSLTLRGVGLGSSPVEIVKAFGKPPVEHRSAADLESGMGQLMELVYDGLKFDLCKPQGQTEFHVWRLIVTGPDWLLEPGIKVGMSRDEARRVLGAPSSASKQKETGRETLHYMFSAFDGWYWVSVAKGTVVEIGAAEDWS